MKKALKVLQIIDKIVCDSLILILHDAYIALADIRSHPHLEMTHILKGITVLWRDTGIVRQDHTDIPF